MGGKLGPTFPPGVRSWTRERPRDDASRHGCVPRWRGPRISARSWPARGVASKPASWAGAGFRSRGSACVALGHLFEMTGQAGDASVSPVILRKANRRGAACPREWRGRGRDRRRSGDGDVGRIDRGAWARGGSCGGAAPEARPRLTGGELVIGGTVGSEAGPGSAWTAGDRGRGRAATAQIVVFGDAGSSPVSGPSAGRSSRWALSPFVDLPVRCTYPVPAILRSCSPAADAFWGCGQDATCQDRTAAPTGDLADLGKGEIRAWTA